MRVKFVYIFSTCWEKVMKKKSVDDESKKGGMKMLQRHRVELSPIVPFLLSFFFLISYMCYDDVSNRVTRDVPLPVLVKCHSFR